MGRDLGQRLQGRRQLGVGPRLVRVPPRDLLGHDRDPVTVVEGGEQRGCDVEVVLGQANLGKALAFGMILVVAATMTVYALLQRRTSRWLR